MRIRSWSLRGRVPLAVLTAIASVAAVVAVPTSAAADPPSILVRHPALGWSAWWEFYNDTEWGYRVAMPEAVVSGSGSDSSGHRQFQGGVTDLTPDGRCAWFTFQESTGYQTIIACNESKSFTQYDPTPAEYTFKLDVRNATGTDHAVSRMVIPNTKYYPELRAAGMGARWHWYSDDEVDFELVRPEAVVLGDADGYPNRHVDATTFSANGCASTQINDDTQEWGSSTACATPGLLTDVSGVDEEFEVRNCLIRSVVSITGAVGRPGPTKCVRMLVR